ncbi:PIG-L family deacetylase [Streptomyces sp. NPDC099050]|uniref:PIG-L family deacetylase n=1 Tax=Streptomyces sp. NPDC099050 TaxID=3366100 RepID=UPI0038109FAF
MSDPELPAEGPCARRNDGPRDDPASGRGEGPASGRGESPAGSRTSGSADGRSGGQTDGRSGGAAGRGGGQGGGRTSGPARAGARTRRARAAARRRRGRVLKAVGAGAAAAAVGGLLLWGNGALDALVHPGAGDAKGKAVGAADPAVPADPGRVLQVLAHPDDDLYFMNPDLRYSIAAGHPVTSVYLTSGEADGINAGSARAATTPPDKPAYAEARQNGIRSAYAQMATGDRDSPWRRTVVPTAGGGHAELDVLTAKPQVNLVWLQMREAGNVWADRPDSLHGPWDGRVPRLESMLASGSPVKQQFTYTKDQVVRSLVGILARYGPTTVRSQDPTPGRFPDSRHYTDHQDHFYGARFVQVALGAYAKEVKDRPHFSVQN